MLIGKLQARSSHYECELVLGGKRLSRLPGAVGRKEAKRPLDRARASAFNRALGKAWLTLMRESPGQLPPALKAISKKCAKM